MRHAISLQLHCPREMADRVKALKDHLWRPGRELCGKPLAFAKGWQAGAVTNMSAQHDNERCHADEYQYDRTYCDDDRKPSI
jgi:hypothetical protein